MKNTKKIISLVLAICMLASLAISASAANTVDASGGTGTSSVTLSSTADGSIGGDPAATKMSVVVPTVLPVAVGTDGTVSTATDAKIINNSFGAVKVANISIDTAREAVVPRAQTGILGLALGTFFDYYVTYVVSAEVGLIQRWFERGLTESPEAMARIMTVLAFVRPGDLYGQPIDINVPEYGMKLLNLQLEDAADTAATVESNN